MDEQDARILLPDPAYRRKVFVLVLCVSLLAAAGTWALGGAFRDMKLLAETDPTAAAESLRSLVNLFSVVTAVVSAVLCVWLCTLTVKTFRSERYPPPGTRVLRPTRVRTGRRARAMAAGLLAFALIVLSSNVLLWHLRRAVESL